MKKIVTMSITTSIDETKLLMERYSSLIKLLRVTAYVFRFVKKCRNLKSNDRKTWLTTLELKDFLHFWIKNDQHRNFHEEIAALHQKRHLPKGSIILNLNPILDNNGILRVGGRLRYSDLPYQEKHPIIVPRKGHLVNLLIDRAHLQTLHGGTQLMMAILQKEFWIINSRNSIRHRVHK